MLLMPCTHRSVSSASSGAVSTDSDAWPSLRSYLATCQTNQLHHPTLLLGLPPPLWVPRAALTNPGAVNANLPHPARPRHSLWPHEILLHRLHHEAERLPWLQPLQ